MWISRPRSTSTGPSTEISGVRIGNIEFYIGDIVLLKPKREPRVAIICEFLVADDETKSANFMLFTSERDIPDGSGKRTDFKPVSLLSLSFNAG